MPVVFCWMEHQLLIFHQSNDRPQWSSNNMHSGRIWTFSIILPLVCKSASSPDKTFVSGCATYSNSCVWKAMSDLIQHNYLEGNSSGWPWRVLLYWSQRCCCWMSH